MKKEKPAAVRKIKKDYEKPRLTRYQKLTSVVAGGTNGSLPAPLGCTRF